MRNGKSTEEHSQDPIYYVKFGYLLNRAGSLGAASMSDLLKEFDIPLPVWHILLILGEFREQTISELASHTGLEMSYLSRTIGKVEERGYVMRRRSTNDRRVINIRLTRAGSQMIERILPKTRDLLEVIFKGIPDSDIETTAQTLELVYDNLASSAATASGDANIKLVVAKRAGKYGKNVSKV